MAGRRLWRLALGRRRDIGRAVDDEIDAHLEMRVAELVARGMAPEDAHREALRRFGDVTEARAGLRRQGLAVARKRRRAARMEALWRDLRLSVRRARRAGAFSAFAVGVFALAIGLTTSVLTVFDTVLVRDLPFPESDRLVALRDMDEEGQPIPVTSMGNWWDWRAAATGPMESTALYNAHETTVGVDEGPVRARVVTVAGAFFETLRPEMTLGRPVAEEEAIGTDRRYGAPNVVVSNPFWARHFGGASTAGTSLTVGAARYDVVGVLAPEAALPYDGEVWISVPPNPETGSLRNNINWFALARLGPGTEAATLEEALTRVSLGIREAEPEAIYAYGVDVVPLLEELLVGVRRELRLLLAGVAVMLLVACVNLAALSLARLQRRRGEVEVSIALGASRGRVMQGLLLDNLLLATLGGALGMLLAGAGTRLLVLRLSQDLPRVAEIGMDGRIGLLAAAVVAAAGLLMSVPSLWFVARRGGTTARLAGVGRGTRTISGGRLVMVETAAAVVLLAGGGLLGRSYLSLLNRDLGFQPEGLMTYDVSLRGPGYRDPSAAVDYWERLLASVREVPGVSFAAAGNWIPTGSGGTSFLDLDDDPEPDGGAGYRVVTDDYFQAMGIPLLTGRAFDARDGTGTDRVAIVNRALVSRFWPDVDPIGRRLRPHSMEAWMYDGDPPWLTVVGVVGDVRHRGYESDPAPEVFVAHRQVPWWNLDMTAVVRALPGAAVQQEVVARFRALDPTVAVEPVPLSRRVDGLIRERKTTLMLVAVFAAAGVGLLAIGVYGLVSFATAERHGEIAIRLTLGAQRRDVVGSLVGASMRSVVPGLALGVLGALLASATLDAMLVGVGRADPVTYGAAAGLVLILAGLGAAVPSRRASKLDPARTLRAE